MPACARCATAGLVTTSPNPQRGDARRLPRPLRNGGGPLGIAPPAACAQERGWRWIPKGWGWAPSPWAFHQAAGGAPPPASSPPPGRYQEQRWQPALARGQAQEGAAPEPLGEGNNPRAFLFFFFFGRPRACCCPPLPFFFFSCAPLPVLLPRWGAELQLNQCSANNLPANKAFSSLSLLPPTPPQSACDGSALI